MEEAEKASKQPVQPKLKQSPSKSTDSVSSSTTKNPDAALPRATKGKSTKSQIPMVPAEGPPDKVWTDYFAANVVSPDAVRDVVFRLHQAKKHDHVIALIEAALVNGQSQPWMYEVLALSMEIAGRPRAEIERVLLSGVDFSAVSLPNMLYSAAYLARFGRNARAMELYRQASTIDPNSPLPYQLGSRHAVQAKDPEGVAWSSAGILAHVWSKDYESVHRKAEQEALELETELRKNGKTDMADKMAATVAEAKKIDLMAELSWSGKADLDLLVEEPAGTICSFETPRTGGGGVLVHDGFGPDQKNTKEIYVCPRGLPGDYRIKVRHVWGDVVGKRATLKITRYKGTPKEIVENLVVQLASEDKVIKVTLNRGRLKELTWVPPVERLDLNAFLRPQPRAGQKLFREETAENRKVREEFAAARNRRLLSNLTQDGAGYQPVISVLSEGVTNSAMAVISADRRYVRISMSPVFSALTDVMTFSFASSGNSGSQQSGGSPRGR